MLDPRARPGFGPWAEDEDGLRAAKGIAASMLLGVAFWLVVAALWLLARQS